MSRFIAIYGSVMLIASVLGGILAGIKRRDWSFWMTISFLFPPAIVLLMFMPKNTGSRPRRESLERQEQRQLQGDERD